MSLSTVEVLISETEKALSRVIEEHEKIHSTMEMYNQELDKLHLLLVENTRKDRHNRLNQFF